MLTVRITALRQTEYPELSALYEAPLEAPCEVSVGQSFLSVNAEKPAGLCASAWETLLPFVKALAEGGGNIFDGWMKDPKTALVSCNDGFRPVSFFLQIEKEIF